MKTIKETYYKDENGISDFNLLTRDQVADSLSEYHKSFKNHAKLINEAMKQKITCQNGHGYRLNQWFSSDKRPAMLNVDYVHGWHDENGKPRMIWVNCDELGKWL